MDKIISNSDISIKNSLYKFIEELYPFCRSITGKGTKDTLSKIKDRIPIEIKEVPTGTRVFDWDIPKEWNIKKAYIKDLKGKKVIDFNKSNLHVVSYSNPINRRISLEELKKHLYTLPEYPDWIPYRTSYYDEDWGFCLSHNQYLDLNEDFYDILIDSELSDGNLSYGEFLKKGETDEEVLISTHICHPSMCNDNLSGITIATHIAEQLSKINTKFSYRIIFIPATIGAITWLSLNEKKLDSIKFGLVLSLLGDNGTFHYKKSRRGNTLTDKIMEYLVKNNDQKNKILDFEPYGYDERQYCSPGINLPVGRLTRTPNKQYKEYHTSADNLDFISQEKLFESYGLILDSIKIIDTNQKFINLYPKGEPQLGRRGIYRSIAGNVKEGELALLWILNYSDGSNDLVDIAIKSKLDYNLLLSASERLLEAKLIELE